VVLALLLSSGLGWTLADPLIAIRGGGIMGVHRLSVGAGGASIADGPELPDVERRPHPRIAESHEAVRMCTLRPALRSLTFIPQCTGWTPKCAGRRPCHQRCGRGGLATSLSGAEVIIHQDPAGLDRSPIPNCSAPNFAPTGRA